MEITPKAHNWVDLTLETGERFSVSDRGSHEVIIGTPDDRHHQCFGGLSVTPDGIDSTVYRVAIGYTTGALSAKATEESDRLSQSPDNADEVSGHLDGLAALAEDKAIRHEAAMSTFRDAAAALLRARHHNDSFSTRMLMSARHVLASSLSPVGVSAILDVNDRRAMVALSLMDMDRAIRTAPSGDPRLHFLEIARTAIENAYYAMGEIA